MVNFSDLEKRKLQPQEAHRKGGELSPKQSGLSFRDLEKRSAGRGPSGKNTLESGATDKERTVIYEEASAYLKQVFTSVRGRQRFQLEPGIQIVRGITKSKSPNDPLLIKAIYDDEPAEFLINHCINVAIFAVKMAISLGLSQEQQIQIGLAALLHEVGTGVIPEKLIYKEQKLTPQEYEVFRKRPEFGYKILEVFGEDYAYLATAVLEVQECIDGSGYPMGLQGDEINEYAQIIGLVNMYEALIHSRPQRERYLHFSAIKEVIRTGKRRYRKKYLKALLNIFSIFPLYSIVKLNSNAIGRVIETYPDQPMRPKLEIVLDSQGRRVVARHIVDLSENSILYIVDSVSEKEIEGIQEGPATKKPVSAGAAPPEASLMVDVPGIDKGEEAVLLDTDPSEGMGRESTPSQPVDTADWAKNDRQAFKIQTEEDSDIDEDAISDEIEKIMAFEKRRRKKQFVIGLVVVLGLIVAAFIWQFAIKGLVLKKSEPSQTNLSQEKVKAKKRTDGQKKTKSQVAEPGKKVMGAVSYQPAAPQASLNKEDAELKNEGEIPQSRRGNGPFETRPANARKAAATISANDAPKTEISNTTAKRDAAANKEKGGIKSFPSEEKETVKGELQGIKPEQSSYPYSIKLDSFRTVNEAQKAVSGYIAKGLSTYWVKVDLGSQGIWYRVFAGHFGSIQQAEAAIQEHKLEGATIKTTKYATRIGKFFSQTKLNDKKIFVSDIGFSPYVIKEKDNSYSLYVGAFYTRKGADEQVADLRANGIEALIVER